MDIRLIGDKLSINKDTLSKECDIIIYHGPFYKTIKNKSMKFVIVEKTNAKIVIQVKSSLQSVLMMIKNIVKN